MMSQERYCPRLDTWRATWGPSVSAKDDHRCVECGAAVVYNPTLGEGEVRLICLECLVNRPD